MNKKVKTGLGVALIIILATTVAAITWKIIKFKQGASLPAPVNIVKNTDVKIKTYKNDRYGFQFEYPADIKISSFDECGGEDPNGPESCSGVNVYMNDPGQTKPIHFDVINKDRDLSLGDFVASATKNAQIISDKYSTEPIDDKEVKTFRLKGGISLGSVQELIEQETLLGFIALDSTRVFYYRMAYNPGSSNDAFYETIIPTLKFANPSRDTSGWRTYHNEKLSFEMKVPVNVDGGPIKIVESGNIVWITAINGYDYSEDNVDKIWGSTNEFKKVAGIPWAILVKNVNNDQELDKFIKDRYGKECNLGEKKPANQAGVFDVEVDGENAEPGVGCFLNWILKIKYSPEKHLVAAWDIGQDIRFVSPDKVNADGISESYDDEMVNSFKFIDLGTASDWQNEKSKLEIAVTEAVNLKIKGLWDKKGAVDQTDSSQKMAMGKWWAKDVWDWIAWKQDDGKWKILVSMDGFSCQELGNIPIAFTDFFKKVTHPAGKKYCY